jgi:hypothetical protein
MKRVVLLSIALALTFACKPEPEKLSGSKEAQIIISNPLDGPLRVYADPDPVTIVKGESVKWTIVYKAGPPLGSVVIDGFKDPSGASDPFGNGSRFAFGYVGSGPSGPTESSGPPVKGGDFKYNVTVTVAGREPVLFDPRLIVNY